MTNEKHRDCDSILLSEDIPVFDNISDAISYNCSKQSAKTQIAELLGATWLCKQSNEELVVGDIVARQIIDNKLYVQFKVAKLGNELYWVPELVGPEKTSNVIKHVPTLKSIPQFFQNKTIEALCGKEVTLVTNKTPVMFFDSSLSGEKVFDSAKWTCTQHSLLSTEKTYIVSDVVLNWNSWQTRDLFDYLVMFIDNENPKHSFFVRWHAIKEFRVMVQEYFDK